MRRKVLRPVPRGAAVENTRAPQPMTPSHDAGASPQAIRRLLARGAGLLELGKADEAIVPLELAHQIDAQCVPVLINLAGAYVMAGRHKEALPLLEAARQAEPHNAMIWLNLGAAYLGNPTLATHEQQMRAVRAFERAVELDPAAPHAHYNMGLIWLDRNDPDRAAAAFRQAILVNPLDRDALSWLRKIEAPQDAR